MGKFGEQSCFVCANRVQIHVRDKQERCRSSVSITLFRTALKSASAHLTVARLTASCWSSSNCSRIASALRISQWCKVTYQVTTVMRQMPIVARQTTTAITQRESPTHTHTRC
eukprot:3163175-Amphidinium_carterae.1